MSEPVRATLRTVRALVEAKTPFNASNLYARATGPAYIVYSYGEHFPLFIFRHGQWYENSEGYSKTTARHRTSARPIHAAGIVLLDTCEMKKLERQITLTGQ